MPMLSYKPRSCPSAARYAVLVALVVALAGLPTTASAAPPVNTAPPTIEGEAFEGRVLKVFPPGSWENGPVVVSLQWQRCNSAGANCQAIAGASNQTYTLTAADAGSTIRIQETATARNGGGTGAPASSSPTAVVQAAGTAQLNVPFSIASQQSSGYDVVTLTNHEAYCVQFYFQSYEGANPDTFYVEQIEPGQTASFSAPPSDEGESSLMQFFHCGEEAGHPPLEIVSFVFERGYPNAVSSIPVNTAPPTITGPATAGQALTAVHGSWTDNPTGYAYQWQRCDNSGNNCQPIAGATAQTYTLTAADVGSTIRVMETASNGEGVGAPASSAPTAVVQAASGGGSQTTPEEPHGGGGNTNNGGGKLTTEGKDPPVSLSPAWVVTQLGQQLTPTGKAAKLGALLKTGGLTMPFTALEAGTVGVSWYVVPAGAKLARKIKAKPVLVASGKLTFSAVGTGQLKIRLTVVGKRLFRHARRVVLTARGTFTPRGGTSLSATKGFVLGR